MNRIITKGDPIAADAKPVSWLLVAHLLNALTARHIKKASRGQPGRIATAIAPVRQAVPVRASSGSLQY